jgi:hypothetical protein
MAQHGIFLFIILFICKKQICSMHCILSQLYLFYFIQFIKLSFKFPFYGHPVDHLAITTQGSYIYIYFFPSKD